MAAEKVVLYRSTDGVLHEKESDCLTRNFTIETRPKLKALITANALCHESNPDVFHLDKICDWLLKDTPALVGLLTPLVTPMEPPRRRRSKADMALEKVAHSIVQQQANSKTSPPGQTLGEFRANEARMLAGSEVGEMSPAFA